MSQGASSATCAQAEQAAKKAAKEPKILIRTNKKPEEPKEAPKEEVAPEPEKKAEPEPTPVAVEPVKTVAEARWERLHAIRWLLDAQVGTTRKQL